MCLYANQFLNSYAESENLVQDVFVRFWAREEGPQPVAVRPYLYRMVRNAVVDSARRNHMNLVPVEEYAGRLEPVFQPDSTEDSTIDLLAAAVEKLPEKARLVFTGVYIEEKKYKEVAESLNISVNTVKSQLSRSLQILREALGGEDPDDFIERMRSVVPPIFTFFASTL